jgi:TatD DNase family protein
MLFDTHTHLDQEEFDDGRADFIARAHAAGVTRIVAVGTTAAASRKCVELAGQHAGVFAAVGIQPNYVAEAAPDDWAQVERLVSAPGVVAVGETGLDRHWDYTPFDQQQDYFDRHIQLAEAHDLPFIVHMRDCDADIMEMLRSAHQRGPLNGIMHSFTGEATMAAECVAMGMHISFAGMVTFKKSQELRECAATIPEDRLLLETDAPYLSPEPVRGKKPNEPAYLRHTAECIAQVRGVSLEELARLTTANAARLFRVE